MSSQYAYDNLPDVVRKRFPLLKDAADELLFKHNNSSVRVATSMRSGTIDRLHVSEMGKIAAMFPIKANEVITGSLPSVLRGVKASASAWPGARGAGAGARPAGACHSTRQCRASLRQATC